MPSLLAFRSLFVIVALSAIALGLAPTAQAQPTACAVEEASVAELQAAMSEGSCSARQITEAYLARIEALDRSGPTLRSVLTVNPDALALADALDAERAAGTVRGPLHGIPVLVKDNVGTADRMPTTAGALALDGVDRPGGCVHRRAAARGRARSSSARRT